ncbi:hypothetical protein LPJ66_006199 [Kickxella alabastrina]|uniref:Uncharacterized protein n=1 Tax=Kickxella alabastrina TaxID=61397 RepID=A0ACC1ICF1_9FUNG|nr:hypothetical protein LPJ66_006199 [Kickxella alabastrina]
MKLLWTFILVSGTLVQASQYSYTAYSPQFPIPTNLSETVPNKVTQAPTSLATTSISVTPAIPAILVVPESPAIGYVAKPPPAPVVPSQSEPEVPSSSEPVFTILPVTPTIPTWYEPVATILPVTTTSPRQLEPAVPAPSTPSTPMTPKTTTRDVIIIDIEIKPTIVKPVSTLLPTSAAIVSTKFEETTLVNDCTEDIVTIVTEYWDDIPPPMPCAPNPSMSLGCGPPEPLVPIPGPLTTAAVETPAYTATSVYTVPETVVEIVTEYVAITIWDKTSTLSLPAPTQPLPEPTESSAPPTASTIPVTATPGPSKNPAPFTPPAETDFPAPPTIPAITEIPAPSPPLIITEPAVPSIPSVTLVIPEPATPIIVTDIWSVPPPPIVTDIPVLPTIPIYPISTGIQPVYTPPLITDIPTPYAPSVVTIIPITPPTYQTNVSAPTQPAKSLDTDSFTSRTVLSSNEIKSEVCTPLVETVTVTQPPVTVYLKPTFVTVSPPFPTNTWVVWPTTEIFPSFLPGPVIWTSSFSNAPTIPDQPIVTVTVEEPTPCTSSWVKL